ncbi:histidine phosphatase family protein [Rhodococcus chondri]|uniref:Histidine phosphatase family protein n=1 Tax=Rhodococcus chondri TaxID=3065941 RepID=A0ABU7JNV5_9NOCA|nr:histidine phosphatase family protein [Rhodococcus sp. CC-R104]MEE2031710.1 histidine phosphatase family protein [Rhodococcus sp. CC-R104]
MQLLLIRHALPALALVEEGAADPPLTEEGRLQADRLPDALSPYRIAKLFCSPQRRALETAAPLATTRQLPVNRVEGLAEYDYGLDHYIPIDTARDLAPDSYARIRAGHLPDFVNAELFRTRVLDAVDEIVRSCEHSDTAVIVAHGGVINVLFQQVLGLERPLTFPIDYASVSRLLISRSGARRVASINETGHVRDMLRV